MEPFLKQKGRKLHVVGIIGGNFGSRMDSTQISKQPSAHVAI